MINKKNNLKLLEINPRPSGSFAVPNLLGINLMDYVLSKKLDVSKKIKIKKIKKDLTITKKKLINIYNG